MVEEVGELENAIALDFARRSGWNEVGLPKVEGDSLPNAERFWSEFRGEFWLGVLFTE